MSARYGPAAGVLECAELTPAPDWQSALPGPALQRCLAALEAAQRALCAAALEALGEGRLSQAPTALRDYVVASLLDELSKDGASRAPDELQQKLLDAPLFAGTRGRLSLRAIAAGSERSGKISVLSSSETGLEIPEDLCVVLADEADRFLLEVLLLRECVDARAEIERARVWKAFLAQPARAPALGDGVLLARHFKLKGVAGVIGYDPGREASAEVLLRGRPLAHLALGDTDAWLGATAGLPVAASFDLDDDSLVPGEKLSHEVEGRIARILRAGVRSLLAAAIAAPQRPECRALILGAIAGRTHHGLASVDLLPVPIFPTLSGSLVSAKDLDVRAQIATSARRFGAELMPGEPVILAEDRAVARALSAFGAKLVDVTAKLAAEELARQRHAQAAAAAELCAPGTVVLRRPLAHADVTGEIALVLEACSELVLYSGRRPLATMDLGVRGVSAAANCDALVPRSSAEAVASDPAFAHVRGTVLDEIPALADDVTRRLGEHPEERARLGRAALPLAGWLAASGRHQHALLDQPLLVATDGRELSPRDLLETQRTMGCVRDLRGASTRRSFGARARESESSSSRCYG